MSVSRRKFTKEVKLAALQRLDGGASIAEVARAFEVNPNLLHRWRKEFRQGPGNAFPSLGKRRWEENQLIISGMKLRHLSTWLFSRLIPFVTLQVW